MKCRGIRFISRAQPVPEVQLSVSALPADCTLPQRVHVLLLLLVAPRPIRAACSRSFHAIMPRRTAATRLQALSDHLTRRRSCREPAADEPDEDSARHYSSSADGSDGTATCAAAGDSAVSRPAPLDGVRVIDLGNIYNGPYCGFLFAQAGADVIKVEAPSGDGARGLSGGGSVMTSQLRYAFENLNAGKRLISLDLKTEEGKETLLALVEKADVLFDNFSPGTLEGLGLGPAVLHAHNPRLVYGQATGYGTVSHPA
jgi:hypothetical protein